MGVTVCTESQMHYCWTTCSNEVILFSDISVLST